MEWLVFMFIVGVALFLRYYIKAARKDAEIRAEYMRISGTTLEELTTDKGVQGEYAIYKSLHNMTTGGHILANLYVPYKGSTTEIDVLLVHKTGVYVIESKNYSGKVYGYEDAKNWAQYLGGKKFSFYNPIKQNQTHMNVLAANGLPEDHMESLIVFGAQTTLQKVTVSKTAPPIITVNDLPRSCKKLMKKRKTLYTDQEVTNLANNLFNRYALASESTKKQHIERIQEKYGTSA